MRKLNVGVLLTAALLVLMSSCDLLEDLGIDVTTNEEEFQFVIPVQEAGTHVLYEENVVSDLDSIVKAEGYSLDQINEAKLYKCEISIVSPETATFDAFESVTAILSTGSIESGEVIAEISSIPAGATELTLVPEEADLKGYLDNSDYTLFVEGVQSEDITEEITVSGMVQFEVKVGF